MNEKSAIDDLKERSKSIVDLTFDRKCILELTERVEKLEQNQNQNQKEQETK